MVYEIWNEEHALIRQDFVSFRGHGTVSALDDVLRLHVARVLSVDGTLQDTGGEHIRVEEEDLLARDLLQAGLGIAFEKFFRVFGDMLNGLFDVNAEIGRAHV